MVAWTKFRSNCRLRLRLLGFCAALSVGLAGCDHMVDQARVEPLEPSSFFVDGSGSRQPVEGTIPRGAWIADTAFTTGKTEDQLVDKIPVAVDQALLFRGQQRFNIFCSPCHGRVGDGDGMIVRRGFQRPPTYHQDRLRGIPVGHFVNVMANGFGAMPSYAAQVPARDRWAIAAYIRALQLSQFTNFDTLDEADQAAVAQSEP